MQNYNLKIIEDKCNIALNKYYESEDFELKCKEIKQSKINDIKNLMECFNISFKELSAELLLR